MPSIRSLLLVSVSLTICSVPNVLADDLNPPAYRGGPLSTSAEWDFETDQNPDAVQPDGDEVPLVVGDAAPLLDAAFPTGAPHPSCTIFGDVEWVDAGGLTGYRPTTAKGGAIACNVPNWIDTEPEKRLRIQVAYTGAAPATAVFGINGVPGTSDGVEEVFVVRVDDTIPGPPALSYFYEDWQIFPNPDWEQVVIFVASDTFVSQLVIDTISGPLSNTGVSIFGDGFETGDTSRWSATTP